MSAIVNANVAVEPNRTIQIKSLVQPFSGAHDLKRRVGRFEASRPGWWSAEGSEENQRRSRKYLTSVYLPVQQESKQSITCGEAQQRQTPSVCVFRHYGQQHRDVIWLSSWTQKQQCPVRLSFLLTRLRTFPNAHRRLSKAEIQHRRRRD